MKVCFFDYASEDFEEYHDNSKKQESRVEFAKRMYRGLFNNLISSCDFDYRILSDLRNEFKKYNQLIIHTGKGYDPDIEFVLNTTDVPTLLITGSPSKLDILKERYGDSVKYSDFDIEKFKEFLFTSSQLS